jgi:diguanylate cyclase (GGDEF)-like protein/PAS domain S-box-containing protein
MASCDSLSQEALIQRLETLQAKVAAQEDAAKEVHRLLHELQVHQIELEIQNRELREAQQYLEEPRDRYADLYDFAPVGYLSLDEQGLIQSINLTGAALFGRERTHLLNKPFSTLLAPTENQRFFEHLHETFRSLRKVSTEIKLRECGGTIFDARLESVAMQDSGGNTRCHTAMLDITELKRTERLLLEEKERAQVTLHSIGDAVISTDAQGNIEYLNPIAETLTGWSLEAARGQALESVFHLIDEQTREPIPNPVTRCLATGHIVGLPHNTLLISRNGQEYPIDNSAAPIRGQDGKVLGGVLVFRDVTEARLIAHKITHQASHDSLTGLVNRREFERRLQLVLASAKQYGTQHALCYLDLDYFKIVNDSAGHSAGDELLRQIAGLLTSQLRARDTLARVGGDEFSLLLENCPLESAVEISENLVNTVKDFRFVWESRTFRVGVSIGLIPITAQSEDAVQFLEQADAACYAAKNLGRNQVYVLQESSHPLALHNQRAREMQAALAQERFLFYSQPIVSLAPADGRSVFYELLLRLVNPQGDIVPPSQFLPAAERYGLMPAIDRWVIRTAFARYAEMVGAYTDAGIAINLSASSLQDESLIEFIHEQFAASAVPPHRVCLEIQATAVLGNLSQATRFIKALKQTGCRFALDQFGSGPTAFNDLQELEVDYLKIDGSLVWNMVENPINHAVVAVINQIGHLVGAKTIAEYVESKAITEQLRQLGVDFAQGYATGAPKPPSP